MKLTFNQLFASVVAATALVGSVEGTKKANADVIVSRLRREAVDSVEPKLVGEGNKARHLERNYCTVEAADLCAVSGDRWDCDNVPRAGCGECISSKTSTDGTTKTVRVDFSYCKRAGCKGAASSISWACCVGVTVPETNTQPTFCFQPVEAEGDVVNDVCNSIEQSDEGRNRNGGPTTTFWSKCEGADLVDWVVPHDSTEIQINTHDGQAEGGDQENICQGSKTLQAGCQGSAGGHCLFTVDLSSCGGGGGGGCAATLSEKEFCQNQIQNPCVDSATWDNTNCICVITYKSAGTECAEAVDAECKAASVCTASGADASTFCPPQGPAAAGTECRSADGVCDVAESCDGTTTACPNDVFAGTETVCRPAIDACDIADYCDGSGPDCPACDKKISDGYTFKCATTQFLCGVDQNDLGISGQKGKGGRTLGTCGIGTMMAYVQLPYPECIDYELKADCPEDNEGNIRGLSNYAKATCVAVEGIKTWSCTEKVDVSDSTPLGAIYPNYTPDTNCPGCYQNCPDGPPPPPPGTSPTTVSCTAACPSDETVSTVLQMTLDCPAM